MAMLAWLCLKLLAQGTKALKSRLLWSFHHDGPTRTK